MRAGEGVANSCQLRAGPGTRIRAKGSFTRALASTGGSCRSYDIRWRVANAFLARGRYTVRLRLRLPEAADAWSKPVQHSRLRKHPPRAR